MDNDIRDKLEENLEDALWQVEEAKAMSLSISKAMNFINLSNQAKSFGNYKLSLSLINKAKELLFSDFINVKVADMDEKGDVVAKIRLDRTIKEARDIFSKKNVKNAYSLINSSGNELKEKSSGASPGPEEKELYSEALDSLQKVWLKMKQEEGKGKDLRTAQSLVKEAKKALSNKDYQKVLDLCAEVMRAIQTPKERLREETDDTIDEIGKTLRALFTDEPTSPKERLFKRQIESLLQQAKENLLADRPVEAINFSRRARDILKKLEQETIKGEIPGMIIEHRAALDELRTNDVDVSYEEYLLKTMEETFWKGEYIEARKIANKLSSIIHNANSQYRMLTLSTQLGDLNGALKEKVGKDGYLEAKEYLDKAKILLDQKAFDMANDFIDKASRVLN
ncbi:MAG: hypothetical protein ACMUIG_05350 [Thermoplasmatota archaeon]